VCLDVASGSLVFAEVAEERREDTWHAQGKARIEALGIKGLSRMRDRAKALRQLAATRLEWLSRPEVLHLLPALVQSSGLSMCRRRRQARQALR
jgi:hypothetical protein